MSDPSIPYSPPDMEGGSEKPRDQAPIIETLGLRKIYGEGDSQVNALDGISIQIYPGEFVAVMGPSGSGKSTLLNILACLDRPSEGQYILNGEDVSSYSRKELAIIRGRELGFVFQSYNLLPRLNTIENVMLPMMYQRENRVERGERREKALVALESVGLSDRINHLPNQLSGGQQQRVAIARALINDPILILADEPTGNLDSRASLEIIALLVALNKKGRTIVMVTHEAEIAHHTERILWIRDGKLASDRKNGQPLVTQPEGMVTL
ncbi:MAG TPA: ABC transporter ATP-binding protein [Anaerolineaceae bacterium]|nr:ABC transporter ATP-binding protein [Anaerolineaceae bacterium]